MKLTPVLAAGLAVAGGAAFLLLHAPRPEIAGAPANPSQLPSTSLPAGKATPITAATQKKPAPTPAEAFAAILNLDDSVQKTGLIDELLQDWATRDAPAAAHFILTIPDEDLRKKYMLHVMQVWGATDPTQALSWAKSAAFDNAYERQVAMSMACTQVARNDPRKAIALAIDYRLDENPNGLLEGLISRWATTDLPAACQWAVTQSAGQQRDNLIESIALTVFDTDPVKATQLVFEQIPAGEHQNKTILALLSRIAFQDPDMAPSWVAALSQGSLRDRAIEQLNNIQNRQN
ncbi:MAG: hypothetical protein JF599_12010 [Verrucomicrobia bacterium]|nr:hypothetical protein [Verrucomicrobiota bacterium]